MIVLAEAVAHDSPAVVLTWPGTYDFLRLRCHYVMADVQPGSGLTVYLSSDGVTFDEWHHYINDGLASWMGEPNPLWWPQPVLIGQPQALNLGCRLGIDVGERPDLAIHVDAEFTAMGVLGGQPVSPTYLSRGYAGFIGGAAGLSARQAHAGGGTWFPGSPVGTPFDWAAQMFFGGHQAAPGARIRGFKLTMNGGGTFGRLITQGYFRAEAMPGATLPVPLPPATIIGDLSAPAYAFDGTIDKASGGGACSWKAPATTVWVGKAWDTPVRLATLTVYPSNNAGWVFNGGPTLPVTVTAYYSDVAPTHATDGMLISAQTIPNGNGPASRAMWTSAQLPAEAHRYHWVLVTHGGAATSMYLAQVVLA